MKTSGMNRNLTIAAAAAALALQGAPASAQNADDEDRTVSGGALYALIIGADVMLSPLRSFALLVTSEWD